MEVLNQFLYDHNIYLNSLAFANFLAFLFVFIAFCFFITFVKISSKASFHLAFVLFSTALLYGNYFIAHAWYSPLAAYHRWFSVGLVLIPCIHLSQLLLHYPKTNVSYLARSLLIFQYICSVVCTIYFVFLSFQLDRKFTFTGHHWDLDADRFSVQFGIIVLIYVFMIPIVGFLRVLFLRGKLQPNERNCIITISIASWCMCLLPGILNILSRQGVISRGLFAIVFTLATVIGIFIILTSYINHIKDASTLLAKIVGVSIASIFIIILAISSFSSHNWDKHYSDRVVLLAVQSIGLGRPVEKNVRYIAKYVEKDQKAKMIYSSKPVFLGKKILFQDMIQAKIYHEILSLDRKNFYDTFLSYISKPSVVYFKGYQKALLEYMDIIRNDKENAYQLVSHEIEKLNRYVNISSIRLQNLPSQDLRIHLGKILSQNKRTFKPFHSILVRYAKNFTGTEEELKENLLLFLRPFQGQQKGIFRKEKSDETSHFFASIVYEPQKEEIYEVGFSYLDYRTYIHSGFIVLLAFLLGILVLLLFLFPLFFRGLLVTPLKRLVDGVEQVNQGNLDISIPIKVRDEIGFLSKSFNKMVDSIRQGRQKLEDYANTLEEQVLERTNALKQTLQEVRALKVQQDGDYYLASLLQKPLQLNWNKSATVITDFYLEQKKQFQFRTKQSEIGGDICISGNLRFGTKENYRRFTVVLNGDAMGKSTQGAGGALVMGVMMNMIMARSARDDRILNVSPEKWLTTVYQEIQRVFLSFDGSMMISCVLAIIDDMSGKMYYFNAEHPFTVVYRDKKSFFIENELLLRKIGCKSDIPFQTYSFQLQPGDVIIMGSDGRDDLELESSDGVRTINEDDTLFLDYVQQAEGKLKPIVSFLKSTSKLTDDLSLVRIVFTPLKGEKIQIND